MYTPLGQAGESTQATLDMPLIRINYKYTSAGAVSPPPSDATAPPRCVWFRTHGRCTLCVDSTDPSQIKDHNVPQFLSISTLPSLHVHRTGLFISRSMRLWLFRFSSGKTVLDRRVERTGSVTCEASARPCARLQAQVLRLASQISPRLIRYR